MDVMFACLWPSSIPWNVENILLDILIGGIHISFGQFRFSDRLIHKQANFIERLRAYRKVLNFGEIRYESSLNSFVEHVWFLA
jgi:hypothetical protein